MHKIKRAINRVNDPAHTCGWRVTQRSRAAFFTKQRVTGERGRNALSDQCLDRSIGLCHEIVRRFFGRHVLSCIKRRANHRVGFGD